MNKMNSRLTILISFLKYVGPGFMIAVGYMDPGNWATDLLAGSKFQYSFLFVILLSNIIAVLLQHLAIKLGVVSNMDLAQACRKHFNFYVTVFLYILCEIAIMACDLAEIIGTAIALNLLFGLKIEYGVLITGLDVFIVMFFWSPRNRRFFEFFIVTLVLIITCCFFYLVFASTPVWIDLFSGFIPNAKIITGEGLYIALGIIGATIMPHNLYLHSSIVKARAPQNMKATNPDFDHTNDTTLELDHKLEKDWQVKNLDQKIPQIRQSYRFATYEAAMCLSLAFLVNSSILIVSSANFYSRELEVSSLSEAYRLLITYLGQSAGVTFAVALFTAGQSSTITATMAGQICMEGFLGSSFKVKPWVRRIITRSLAIIPAVIVAVTMGEEGVNALLVLSQVVLSMQLPFAVWPLIWFTSSGKIMDKTEVLEGPVKNTGAESVVELSGDGEERKVVHRFRNHIVVIVFACLAAGLITGLNVFLLISLAIAA